MADTTEIDIDNDAWTDISGGSTSGFFTNFGDNVVLFREAPTAAPPAEGETRGHRLNPASDAVAYEMASGQGVFARSVAPKALIIVTTS